MPIISEEKYAELASRFKEETPTEGADANQEAHPVEQSEKTVDVSEKQTETKQDVTEGSSPNVSDKAERQIPYDRFSKVVSARNKSQKDLIAAQAKIQELELALKGSVSTAGDTVKRGTEHSWLDELLSSNSEEDNNYAKQFETLNNRINQFEIREQQQLLQLELQEVSKQYPDVPRELLLQSVIQNPNTSLNDVAARYTKYIADISEKAVADYKTKNPPTQTVTPPRPKQTAASRTPTAKQSIEMSKEQRFQALKNAINKLG